MRAGKLDRRLQLLQWSQSGTDALNQPIESWSVLATVWARKIPMGAAERMQAQQMSAQQVTQFEIRYRDDLSVKGRVALDGAVYEVTGITEIGRRVGLQLDCVAVAA